MAKLVNISFDIFFCVAKAVADKFIILKMSCSRLERTKHGKYSYETTQLEGMADLRHFFYAVKALTIFLNCSAQQSYLLPLSVYIQTRSR